jgi:hypothetical protein
LDLLSKLAGGSEDKGLGALDGHIQLRKRRLSMA